MGGGGGEGQGLLVLKSKKVFFFFLHLALITELFITESRKILSWRGAHPDRFILCPLVKCKKV